MKGFFKWFKGSTRIKRWMFMIIVGIALACFGFSKVLTTTEISSIIQIVEIVIPFVIGFILVVLGLVFIQRRTLELVIEANQRNNDININSLIFNKNVYEKGPKVVVIGGGSGLNTVLRGLKKYTNNITAIVTVSDYGEIATTSRKELDLKPIEDIKTSMISLSNHEEHMNALLNYTFESGKLANLSFGDIYLSAMQNIYGDFTNSIEKASKVLRMVGKVLPVTLDEMQICAELKDGTVVNEKDKISETVYEKITKIDRIYLTPSNCRPAPGVLEAIEDADAIIIGPGNLYTNVIPNLLIKGVAKAIKTSKAIRFYISNIMTEPGQTDNYSVSDHISAITEHTRENIIDYCIGNSGEIVPEYVRRYNKEGSDVVDVDTNKLKELGVKVIKKDIAKIEDGYIRHDTEEIAKTIMEFICNDLKFKNKQTETQYTLLNSRLKYKKKLERKIRKNNKAENKEKNKFLDRFLDKINSKNNTGKRAKRASKFQDKYRDRIDSIRHEEATRKKYEDQLKNNK